MKTALFPGSFDPFTIGHHDILVRALAIFDEIIIAIGRNSLKPGSTTLPERLEAIQKVYANEPRVRVHIYEGLTIDFAQQVGASCILRGVRSVQDFEYERQIADANKQLSGIDTVLLYTRPEYAHISSSLLRELQSYGRDITPYLPQHCQNCR